MPTSDYTARGASLIDENSYHPNFEANEGDNLIFKPNGDNLVMGEANLTFAPVGILNNLWSSVLAELQLQSSNQPADFQTILSLFGITGNKSEHLIGEHKISSLPSTETTTIYAFDLLSSACGSSLIVDNNITTTGKIQVNLPHRWRSPLAVGFDTILLTIKYFFTDNFNDASINPKWTPSTPVGSITESGGTMNVNLGSGVASGSFNTCPIVTNPLPTSGNWIAGTKLTNTSLNGEVNTGLILLSDRNNLGYIECWRSGGGSYYVDGGNKTTKYDSSVGVSSPTLYFEIEYKNGRYYFKYSTNGTNFTTYYSTSNLGFAPTAIGFFSDHWGANQPVAATFDYFYLTNPTGDATYDQQLSPSTTPGNNDTSILFNTPSPLYRGAYADVTTTELNNYPITTRATQVADKSILNLGYSGLDIYDALKFKIQTYGDKNCNVKCNWIICKVEV